MRWNIIGAFIRNKPFGTEIAFQKGLERIGETVTVIDPSYPYQKFDESADVTVLFKWIDPGEYRNTLTKIGGKKIVYQPDDLRFPHIKKMMHEMRNICDHAFTFDNDGADLAIQYGYKSAQRLLLTADNTLYRRIPNMQKDIDVCFIGSMSNGDNHKSRMKMLNIVSQMKGVRLATMNELFDIGMLNGIYNRSKIVLNHATDVGQPFGHGYGYQCRHFEAGLAGAFVLSNEIDNERELKNIMTFHDEESLVGEIRTWLDSSIGERQMVADSLYEELNKSHLPEHRAQEMLEFVKRIS